MKIFSLFSAGLCLLSSLSLYAGDVQNSFPADTQSAFRIDLEGMRSKSLIIDIENAMALPRQMFLGKMKEKSGVDMDKINTIWMTGNDNFKGIGVFIGDFDENAIREASANVSYTKIVEREDGRFSTKTQWKRKSKTFVFIDSKTLIMGDDAQVNAFIDNFDGKGTVVGSDIQSKINAIASSTNLVQGEMFSFEANDKMNKRLMKRMPWLTNVTSGSFSATIDDDLRMTSTIKMKDAEQAEALVNLMSSWKTLAMSFQGKGSQFPIKKEFMESMKFEKNDTSVTVSAFLNSDSIRSMMKI